MARSKSIDRALELRFEECERRSACLNPADENERRALSARVEKGGVVRPFPAMYARAAYWEKVERADKVRHVVRALAKTHPTWVFSHATAALMYGIDVSHKLLWPINFTTDRENSGKKSKHCKHHRLSYVPFHEKDGIKVTPPALTVCDCARTYDLPDALAIADAAVRRGIVTRYRLLDEVDAHAGWRGIKQARIVADLVDPRAQSGGESMVRALMYEFGLPQPELQRPFENPEHPGQTYYADFTFTRGDGRVVVLELDGMEKYLNENMTQGKSMAQVMAAERQREALITAHDVSVARIDFAHAMRPNDLIARLKTYGIVPQEGARESWRPYDTEHPFASKRSA